MIQLHLKFSGTTITSFEIYKSFKDVSGWSRIQLEHQSFTCEPSVSDNERERGGPCPEELSPGVKAKA